MNASGRRLLVSLLTLLWWVSLSLPVFPAAQIQVDFHNTNGWIRPLHGVNLGPLCYRGTVDLSAYHRELGVPLTRLHDVCWLNAEAVDIHCVFPEFNNDPQKLESYRFAATDDYIQAIANVGSRIVYRLGESIEHTPRKYHVQPPPDSEKWAAICLGIIRHYQEGWGGGQRLAIDYWEIWNEPDVRPAMWTGTDEQYFRLFEVTAKAIKARFPQVKVGGPALGGTGALVGDAFTPSPFLTNFLAYCQQHQAPLDFFSWHQYTSQPSDLARRAKAVRRTLDQYGFTKAESHLNEWNYLPNDDWRPMLREGQGAPRQRWYEQMNGPEGAAFAAFVLCQLQDAPVNAANYYTGEIQGFGLFDINGIPKTTYYAFKAFRELLDTPIRVQAKAESDGQCAFLAGVNSDGTQAALLFSHFKGTDESCEIALSDRPWPGATAYQILVVDAEHALTEVGQGNLAAGKTTLPVRLKAPAVALVKLRPQT
jgi:xylan 1,4-beta-xylosidase